MAAPLFEALQSFQKQDKVSFHMPGHKNGKGIDPSYRDAFLYDTTELVGTDNLHEPTGCIAAAQKEAARAFGARETFFHVNGSTGAMLTALFAVCRRGDTILVNENAHACVLSAATLLDLTVVFYPEEPIESFHIMGSASIAGAEKTAKLYQNASAIVMTSPNYYGVGSDVSAMAKLAHRYDMCLIVDEAHGAHFSFSTLLPASAILCGADLVVQSAHKTLCAPTQSALLHRGSERVSHAALQEAMDLLISSSPSYILMAYMDLAREQAEKHGEKLYAHLIEKIKKWEDKVEAETAIWFLKFSPEQPFMFYHDPTRVVAHVGAYAVTGRDVERTLQKEGIFAEMADEENVVFIVTMANDSEDLSKLFSSLLRLAKTWKLRENKAEEFPKDLHRVRVCRPAIVRNQPFESLPLEKAVGHIAKRTVSIYPPHVPIVTAGEVIDEAAIYSMRHAQEKGLTLMGLCQGKIDVLLH